MQAVSIDFSELEYAFGDQRVYAEHAWYLDRTNGDLVLFNGGKPEIDRFVYVPPRATRETLADMRAFAETITDRVLASSLFRALTERGALRRFKDALLEAPTEREHWLAFERERMHAYCKQWLAARGIAFTSRCVGT
jgi:hypothetical protein